MRERLVIAVLLLAGVPSAPALGATPPQQMNYQGVLRDASDNPLSGSYDMTFSFWSAPTGGDEIFDDAHLASGTGAVTVSNGLFNAALGGGSVTDGPGPGSYTALDMVFRDYPQVWIQIKIGAETLSPRTRVLASGYAFNATNLGGQPANSYLDTSGSTQNKTGGLVAGFGSATSTAQLAAGTYGVNASGSTGSYFGETVSGASWSYLANNGYGVQGQGVNGGGYFANQGAASAATLAGGTYGVLATVPNASAFLATTGGYGVYASGGTGVYGSGLTYGVNGSGTYGVYGSGSVGVYGSGTNHGVEAYGGPTGVYASGATYGVYGTSGNYGVYASGGPAAVYGSGTQDGVDGVGGNTGVYGSGGTYGVYGSGGSNGQYGVYGISYGFGVYGQGIYPSGSGGWFRDAIHSGQSYLGDGDTGVAGTGNFAGAHFTQGTASGAYAYLAYSSTGVAAYAVNPGENPSYFNSAYNGNWASVGQNTSKVTGNGSMGFVQNHPEDPTREIVYNAPEGDEIAVYTRGSSRLVGGEARVALGETFRWVTNPDAGLTAHLTPRDEAVPLAVVSVTPTELVVRGPAGAATAFDYLVYGLRIGFEERPVVRPKTHESPIPGKVQDEELFAAHPGLRAYTALARHAAMRAAVTGAALDLARAKALEGAVGVAGTPGVAVEPTPDPRRMTVAPPPNDAPALASSTRAPEPGRTAAPAAAAGPSVPVVAVADSAIPTATWIVSEPVQAGDVLVLDDAHPGMLRRGAGAMETGYAGIAASPSVERDGGLEVALVESLHGAVLADAAPGAIRPGDLLVSSPLPGHAMRAPAGAPAAAIVGKALEALESGQGTVRVLLASR